MLKTKVRTANLSELNTLAAESGHENARFMKPAMYKRLVENLRKDGALTSVPLVGQFEAEPGKLYVISGNHRVMAARDAGIESAHVIEILEPMTEQQFIAIQLSHNAVEGEDDKSALQRLYEMLDLDLKEYSGLTDDAFDMDDLNVTTLSGVSPLYVDVVFSFLADDAQAVADFLQAADKWVRKGNPVFASEHAQFDQFFDALVRLKNLKGITNSAIALATMIQLARERMDQIESESDQQLAG